ncbi:MAG: sialidase family protein [Bacteroidia bacterium]
MMLNLLFFWFSLWPSTGNLPDYHDVFVSGKEGYHTYRIPSVVCTRSGILLAFAEGRINVSDHAQNDLVMKRSTDGGLTWGPLVVLQQEGENSLNNPQAVVLNNGQILLVYNRYPKEGGEHFVQPGLSGDSICRTFLIRSKDEGKTWSAPREITAQIKRPTWATSTAAGPGIGIQLTRGAYKGRIIMPFNQGPYGKWSVYAAYSDDNGKNWSYGEIGFEDSPGMGNEVQVVERSDGSILLNARNQGGNKYRKTAISRDGGQNWTGLIEDAELPEPQCMGSILRYSFEENGNASVILFSNPASQTGRENGTLKISYDEGETWPGAIPVYDGSFAYSCLTKLPDGTVGVLFEADKYHRIVFARISSEKIKK